MRIFFAPLVALLAIGCAYHNPDAPSSTTTTTTPPVSTTAPFSLTLGAAVGQGAEAGRAVVTAKVQNANGAVLPGVTVGFSTDLGTLSAATALTNAEGNASTTIAASGPAKVTATAGSVSAQMLVASQPVVPTPTPPPAPQPPPTTPLGPLSMTLSTSAVVAGNPNLFTLNVLNASGAYNVTWDYGDGTTGTGTSSTTAHQYGAAGTYRATAILRDDAGRSASASVSAVVTAAPVVAPPSAPSPAISVALAASSTTVAAGGSSTITATATSTNGAAAATSYTFDCNNDGTADITGTALTSFLCTFPTAGTTTVKVTATNGTVSGAGTIAITVSPPPAPSYTVTLAASPSSVVVGGSSTLTASVQQLNGAAAPTSYAWDCTGDGVVDFNTGSNVQACTYSTAGTVTARVTVSGVSAQASATTPVTVTAAPAPTVSVACASNGKVGVATTCVASATVNGSPVPATRITSVDWNFGDGQSSNGVSGNTAQHTYTSANTFTVFATATISGVTGTVTGSGTTTIAP
jgi:PKD repeat protein